MEEVGRKIEMKQQIKKKSHYGISCEHMYYPAHFFEYGRPDRGDTRKIDSSMTVGTLLYHNAGYINSRITPLLFLEHRADAAGVWVRSVNYNSEAFFLSCDPSRTNVSTLTTLVLQTQISLQFARYGENQITHFVVNGIDGEEILALDVYLSDIPNFYSNALHSPLLYHTLTVTPHVC